MSANLRIVESPTLPAVVPNDAGGIISILPKLQAIAEQSSNADELRMAGAYAKGMKETAKALGIAELHAELSWIEETAVRRRAAMEKQPGARKDLFHNERGSTNAEHINLSRARERHADLSDHQFARLKEESLEGSIPATPKLIMQAAGHHHVSHNSLENEWYTPAPIIAAARAVMGGIDLDPASSAKANETVQATTFYSIEDDGLNKEWQGRVWMNPPYAAKLIPAFIDKLSTSNITQAIVLTNNATETQWGQSCLVSAIVYAFLPAAFASSIRTAIQVRPCKGRCLSECRSTSPYFLSISLRLAPF